MNLLKNQVEDLFNVDDIPQDETKILNAYYRDEFDTVDEIITNTISSTLKDYLHHCNLIEFWDEFSTILDFDPDSIINRIVNKDSEMDDYYEDRIYKDNSDCK